MFALFRRFAVPCASVVLAAAAMAAPQPADWTRWQRDIDRQPSLALKELSAEDPASWPPTDRLRLELMQVRALLELGRTDEAAVRLTALQPQLGTQPPDLLAAPWHAYRATVQIGTDRFDDALRELDLALQAARRAGDLDLQGYTLIERIQVALARHDMRAATEASEALHALAQSSGDADTLAHQLYWAGNVQQALQDYASAADLYRQATAKFHALDDRTGESDSQRLLASVLIEADRSAEALEPAQRAIALLETLDDSAYLALARTAYAVALAHLGRGDEALALSQRALDGMAGVRDSAMQLSVWLWHAEVLGLVGRAAEALDVAKREVQPRIGPGHPSNTQMRRYHLMRAEALSALGRAAEAREAWHQVMALDKMIASRVLAGQLAAQGAVMDMRRLQAENELLQLRNERAERALNDEARKRLLGGGVTLAVLLAATGGLLWMRRVNRQIARVADHDALTGLLNRRSVLNAGLRALQGGTPFAVLLIDVDHFKTVNDTLGHAAGDEALRQVAQRLRQGVRKSDHLARWGGEEFLVLLPGTGAADAMHLAERQRLAVAEAAIAVDPQALPLRLTVSVGLAMVAEGEAGLEAAIERADRALYRAKQEGRNRWVAHGPPAVAGTPRHDVAETSGAEG